MTPLSPPPPISPRRRLLSFLPPCSSTPPILLPPWHRFGGKAHNRRNYAGGGGRGRSRSPARALRTKTSATPRSSACAGLRATGCKILGKAEFLNPGGSVKDRAALFIILDAEQRGRCARRRDRRGHGGNTGIGLALVGNARGYRTVIVIPETQSQEKKDTLRLCGAELREVPAVPYKDPNNYVHVAERLAPREPRRLLGEPVGQHREPRRPLPQDRPGDLGADRRRVDGFICAIGTGGTLAGVSELPQGEESEESSSAAPIRWARRCTTTSDGELKAKGARSPKASARAASPRTSKARRRRGVPDPGRGGAADPLRPPAKGGPLPRRLERDQRRRRDPPRARARPGHTVVTDPRRLRHALPVQALHPSFPTSEGLPPPDWP